MKRVDIKKAKKELKEWENILNDNKENRLKTKYPILKKIERVLSWSS